MDWTPPSPIAQTSQIWKLDRAWGIQDRWKARHLPGLKYTSIKTLAIIIHGDSNILKRSTFALTILDVAVLSKSAGWEGCLLRQSKNDQMQYDATEYSVSTVPKCRRFLFTWESTWRAVIAIRLPSASVRVRERHPVWSRSWDYNYLWGSEGRENLRSQHREVAAICQPTSRMFWSEIEKGSSLQYSKTSQPSTRYVQKARNPNTGLDEPLRGLRFKILDEWQWLGTKTERWGASYGLWSLRLLASVWS